MKFAFKFANNMFTQLNLTIDWLRLGCVLLTDIRWKRCRWKKTILHLRYWPFICRFVCNEFWYQIIKKPYLNVNKEQQKLTWDILIQGKVFNFADITTPEPSRSSPFLILPEGPVERFICEIFNISSVKCTHF